MRCTKTSRLVTSADRVVASRGNAAEGAGAASAAVETGAFAVAAVVFAVMAGVLPVNTERMHDEKLGSAFSDAWKPSFILTGFSGSNSSLYKYGC